MIQLVGHWHVNSKHVQCVAHFYHGCSRENKIIVTLVFVVHLVGAGACVKLSPM